MEAYRWAMLIFVVMGIALVAIALLFVREFLLRHFRVDEMLDLLEQIAANTQSADQGATDQQPPITKGDEKWYWLFFVR